MQLNRTNSITILLVLVLIIIASWLRKWTSEPLNENETESDNMGNLQYKSTGEPKTANFSLSELACKDGTAVPKIYYGNAQSLMEQLQIIRDYIGVPIHINSGYRTPQHNKSVGGATNSMHLLTKAADLVAVGFTAATLANKIEELIKAGKIKNGGVGRYSSFVHYDIGLTRRWNG